MVSEESAFRHFKFRFPCGKENVTDAIPAQLFPATRICSSFNSCCSGTVVGASAIKSIAFAVFGNVITSRKLEPRPASSRLVSPLHWRSGSARRHRLDPSLALENSPKPHAARRRRISIIMIGATVLTLIIGDISTALIPLATGMLCVFVAYGRWRLTPLRANPEVFFSRAASRLTACPSVIY